MGNRISPVLSGDYTKAIVLVVFGLGIWLGLVFRRLGDED